MKKFDRQIPNITYDGYNTFVFGIVLLFLNYRDLLNAEIQFCNRNIDKIMKMAKRVYKIGTNRKHKLAYTCCDFKLLEEKCKEYVQTIASKESAATDERTKTE